MINEKTLYKDIKNKIDRLYFLHGSEPYLIDKYKNLIVKFFQKQNEDIELIKISFDDLDLSVLNDEINSVGFFSTNKIVCITDVKISKFKKNDKDFFIEILQGVSQGSLVILCAETSSEKTTTLNSFIKSLPQDCVVAKLESRTRSENIDFIVKTAKKNGSAIDKFEAEFLLDLLKSDMFLIENEVLKLSSYKVNEKISVKDIDDLVKKSVEESVFLLLDYIFKKDVKSSIELVQSLIYEGQDPIGISGALVMSLIDVYRYKLMKQSPMDQQEFNSKFSYKPNDFRVKKASWNDKKVNVATLEKILMVLYETDKKMKSSSTDNNIMFECCIINIINIYKERI